MRRALEALVALVLATIALPAASVASLPFPAGDTSAAEAQAEAEFNQAVLDASWAALSISTTQERPVVDVGEPLEENKWLAVLVECVTAAGYGDIALQYDQNLAIVPSDLKAAELEPAGQLAFYRCLAAHPRDTDVGDAFSPAQIDYLYDYFERWLVPCLVMNGYEVSDDPTRDEFVKSWGVWSPFWWVTADERGDPIDDVMSYNRMIDRCGQDWPGPLR